MGCQRSIARQIIDAGTDYLPAAKPITLRPIPVSLNFTLQLNNYRRRSVAKWPSSITMRLKAMVASRHVTAPRSTGRRSTRSPPPLSSVAISSRVCRQMIRLVLRSRYTFVGQSRACTGHWMCHSARTSVGLASKMLLRTSPSYVASPSISSNKETKVGIKLRRLKACANHNYLAKLIGWVPVV